MSEINEIFRVLLDAGVNFRVEAGKLFPKPKKLLTPERRLVIRNHKDALMALVSSYEGLGPKQAKYMHEIVIMFQGGVILPGGYPETVNKPLPVEQLNKERILNRTEYRKRLKAINEGDYSLAKVPFRKRRKLIIKKGLNHGFIK